MKTNRQQLVTLMLPVIPTTLTIVTTTTTAQQAVEDKQTQVMTHKVLNDNGVPRQVQASGQSTPL